MPIKPENKKLYPIDWKAIRAEVLDRAGHVCEFCGRENHRRYNALTSDSVLIVLTIAHLDHDPTNNGEPGNRPNLRALCQRCHNRHDAKMRSRNSRLTRRSKLAAKELF